MVMDINEIREYLPHRYPFLLVDRVTQLTVGETIVAYKNVSINEPFFNGHFPHHPIMPGVLDTTTSHIEHPRLVAQRLMNYVRLVGGTPYASTARFELA